MKFPQKATHVFQVALKMPKATPDEISARDLALDSGLKKAIGVPLGLATRANSIWDTLSELAQVANINCKSDLQVTCCLKVWVRSEMIFCHRSVPNAWRRASLVRFATSRSTWRIWRTPTTPSPRRSWPETSWRWPSRVATQCWGSWTRESNNDYTCINCVLCWAWHTRDNYGVSIFRLDDESTHGSTIIAWNKVFTYFKGEESWSSPEAWAEQYLLKQQSCYFSEVARWEDESVTLSKHKLPILYSSPMQQTFQNCFQSLIVHITFNDSRKFIQETFWISAPHPFSFLMDSDAAAGVKSAWGDASKTASDRHIRALVWHFSRTSQLTSFWRQNCSLLGWQVALRLQVPLHCVP